MRNAWTIVLMAAMFGLVLVTFITGDLFLIFLAVTCFLLVAAGGYMNLLMQKHSPALLGPGYRTSIVNTNPLNRVKLTKPKGMKEDVVLDIFGAGGMAEFGMAGGGKHGYAVVRNDLEVEVPGDDSAIWVVSAPPDLYAVNPAPGSGYKDFEGLPDVLKDALRTTKHWHPRKSKVTVFWNHPRKNPMNDVDEKSGMSWQAMYEEANKEIEHLKKKNRSLMKGSEEIANTHAKAMSAMRGVAAEDAEEEDE